MSCISVLLPVHIDRNYIKLNALNINVIPSSMNWLTNNQSIMRQILMINIWMIIDGYIWVNMNKLWSLYFELGNQGHLTMKNEQQISVLVIQIKDSRYGLLQFRYHNKQTTHSRVCEITISFVHLQLNPVVMDCIVINENGILTIHMKWISIQQ